MNENNRDAEATVQAEPPAARRVYVPPALTKKRSVARVTLQTSGVGQSTSPVIASPPATP